MLKKSIIIKLFIVTTLVFTIFLGIAMASQALFFQKYYIREKRNHLQKSVEEFGDGYRSGRWTPEEVVKNINRFVDENNAMLAILDENGVAKFTNSYGIEVETEDKQRISISLNNIAYAEELQKLSLTKGAEITAEGIYMDNTKKNFAPSKIETGGNVWQPAKNAGLQVSSVGTIRVMEIGEPEDGNVRFETTEAKETFTISISDKKNIETKPASVLTLSFQKVAGTVVDVKLPSQMEFATPLKTSALWEAINDWFWTARTNNIDINTREVLSYEYSSPSDGQKSVIFVKPLLLDGNGKETVFAMASLQPVGEAIAVMRNYYVYAFFAALLFITALSLIYSRMIAKPLIKLNASALQMANFDFSVECDIQSKDEIGSLSSSLNTLAGNLDKSLRELKAANRQLQEDIEKERALEKMRKEFVSDASHELKTPLGIIRAFAEGLKDDIAADKKDYYMDVILDEAEKMNGLLLDMLDLAKLESGVFRLQKSTFPIAALCRETVSRFSKHIHEKSITVRCEFRDAEVYVNADERRIGQVLANLFSNAVRHTGENGFIKLGLERRDGKVDISIENSGPGIPEENVNRIWDRFYRLEESRNRRSGGTGLGLAIVKNILELHESDYGVKNTQDGVRFYFTLETVTPDFPPG